MSRITSVTPKDGYLLEVHLDNGNSITLDFKTRLKTLRFGILADESLFNQVTTDGVCLSWKGKVEISLSELLQLAQK